MTPTEKDLIAKAACDIATGNHLLYPRSEEEMAMLKEVCEALNTPEEGQTARQKDICEEYRLCTDYKYWRSKHRDKEKP